MDQTRWLTILVTVSKKIEEQLEGQYLGGWKRQRMIYEK
jgi:hypothetical protein